MIIYIAANKKKQAKKRIPTLKECAILDIDEIKKELNYGDKVNEFSKFIINASIQKKINSIINSKRFSNLLYYNEDVTLDVIENLKLYFSYKNINIERIVLIDIEDSSSELHSIVDEVVN